MTTFRYLPQFRTREEIERWCDENALVIVALDRGPDGLMRGIARDIDDEAAPA